MEVRTGTRVSERDNERGKEEEEGTDDRAGTCWRTRQREEVRSENRGRAEAELSAG